MIAAHAPDAILNFGCTGAHERHVNVGDVVIGTRSVSHTSMVIVPDGTGRFDLHDGMKAPAAGQTGIASDPALLAIAREAANGWTPERWVAASDDSPVPRVHEGVVASADVCRRTTRLPDSRNVTCPCARTWNPPPSPPSQRCMVCRT